MMDPIFREMEHDSEGIMNDKSEHFHKIHTFIFHNAFSIDLSFDKNWIHHQNVASARVASKCALKVKTLLCNEHKQI